MSDKSKEIPNLPETAGPSKDFDTLLVSDYITEHLYPSQLDAFFEGGLRPNPPATQISPILRPKNMKDLIGQAKNVLEDVRRGKKFEIVSHSLRVSLLEPTELFEQAFDGEQLLKTVPRNTVALAEDLGSN